MNIWIIQGNTGLTLYYKSFMDLKVNEHLVSGLITALNQFTLVEFKQPIESIDMGGLRWIYIPDRDSGLLFVASDEKKISAEIIRARLNIIKQSFIEEFIPENWKDTWQGEVSIFESFTPLIENYYNQWTQMEKVITSAEFFDILGIFQQLLNMTREVVEEHTAGLERDMIYKKINEVFESFMSQQIIKHNPELGKITYMKDSGFNLLNIDPSNCDVVIVENQIVFLISEIVQIIKDRIGHELALVYFDRSNIYTYLFNNISLLKELNLDIFFMRLYLS